MGWRIPASFPRLLTRLGITVPGTSFDLQPVVVPVSLVDTDITIPTSTLPPAFAAPASAGEINNPAANTRMADTLALAAGNYYVQAMYSVTAGTINYRLRRRNAADAADIWSQTFAMGAGSHDVFPGMVFTLAANERFVIEHVTGGVGGICQGSLFVTPV